MVHQLATAELAVKKEAAWCVSNALEGGTPEQVQHVIAQGCVKPLCDLAVTRCRMC